jgi:Fe-S-cluster containining protein
MFLFKGIAMHLKTKLTVLKKIYKIYDDFAGDFDVACKKYCDQCCTNSVSITTLEGYLIAEKMILNGKSDLFRRIKATTSEMRFQPKITTNRLADLCMNGKDLPEEKNNFGGESCPLLKSHECPVYSVRPFGCRCFMSKHDCSEKGYAEVDELVITLNTIFLQYIEHIDAQGFSGNLTDILVFMQAEKNRHAFKTGKLKNPEAGFIANQPTNVLMVPPEDRRKVKPILKALQDINLLFS